MQTRKSLSFQPTKRDKTPQSTNRSPRQPTHSPQDHYDWGLRSLKAALKLAGRRKRSSPDLAEGTLIAGAIRDFNLPKIPMHDVGVFTQLLSDIFSPTAVSAVDADNEKLKLSLDHLQIQAGFVHDPEFTEKVLQLEQLLKCRHSVMILGVAGAGKTTIWQMLHKALNVIHAEGDGSEGGDETKKPTCCYEVVNPKAVTADELFGHVDAAKEWRDGVLSIILRNMRNNVTPFTADMLHKWVVLDGDVDSLWIENLNSVMDDNKMLTLVNNERIPLDPSMRMLFEVHKLDNATPATISRAAMLYVNKEDIGWTGIIESWVARRADLQDICHNFTSLCNRHVGAALGVVKDKRLANIVPMSGVSVVHTVTHLLGCLLDSMDAADKQLGKVEKLLVFCIMSAFGASFKSTDSAHIFAESWKDRTNLHLTISSNSGSNNASPRVGKVGVLTNRSTNLCECFLNMETMEFQPWQDRVPVYMSDSVQFNFGHVVIPTAQTVRVNFLMGLLLSKKRPVLLVGEAGIGKTLLVSDHLQTQVCPG